MRQQDIRTRYVFTLRQTVSETARGQTAALLAREQASDTPATASVADRIALLRCLQG